MLHCRWTYLVADIETYEVNVLELEAEGCHLHVAGPSARRVSQQSTFYFRKVEWLISRQHDLILIN